MATIIEKTGKSVEEALQLALNELGVSADEVDVEVLETPSKGIFGILGLFGAKPARIRVTLKEIPQTPAPAVAENVSEPPTIVNFKFVPDIDSLPKVDAEFKDDEVTTDNSQIEKSDDEVVPPAAESVEGTENIFDRAEVIVKAKIFLTDIFNAMKIEVAINVREDDSNVILDLVGKDSALLIGKRGQMIDALQYLTNLAANRAAEDKVRFILDVENYRERREETLIKMAKNVADRVARIKQEVKMEPMSRHERRIIHTALQDNKRVETHSFGEDPYRYVVVSPVKRK